MDFVQKEIGINGDLLLHCWVPQSQSYTNNDLTEVVIQIKIYLLYLDAIVQFLRFVYEDLHTSLSIMKIFRYH